MQRARERKDRAREKEKRAWDREQIAMEDRRREEAREKEDRTSERAKAMKQEQEGERQRQTPGVVKCRVCGKEVAAGAKTCPHCGVKYPGISVGGVLDFIDQASSALLWLGLGSAALLVFLLVSC